MFQIYASRMMPTSCCIAARCSCQSSFVKLPWKFYALYILCNVYRVFRSENDKLFVSVLGGTLSNTLIKCLSFVPKHLFLYIHCNNTSLIIAYIYIDRAKRKIKKKKKSPLADELRFHRETTRGRKHANLYYTYENNATRCENSNRDITRGILTVLFFFLCILIHIY